MRAHMAWGLAAAAVLVLVFAIPMTVWRPRAIEIELVQVRRGTVEDVVTNSDAGTVRTRREARLGFEQAGRVAAIARDGAFIRRGAVVARLDDADALARLEAARRDSASTDAAHDVAHADATLAASEFERTRRLREQAVVSDAELDEARSRMDAAAAALRAAEARLLGARAAVRLAEVELAHLAVRAPFDGVVTRRAVEVGASVIPGQPALDLVSLGALYVSAPMDERDAGALAAGLPARITVDTWPGRVWNARVTRVAPVIETAKEQNRTVEVEVDVPPDPGLPALRPGMTADVEVVLARHDDVVRVPTAAVMDGRRVYRVEGGRARARDVVVGLHNWEWTEVRSGLGAGELVITSLDRAGLADGVAVRAGGANIGPAAPDTASAMVTP